MERNESFLLIYPLPALLTLLPLIPFTTDEITGHNIATAKGANKAPRNPPSCFFYFVFYCCFHTFSNTFMILIISFISPFKINKLNLFPASFSLVFIWNLFVAFEVKLLTNPGKLFVAKGIATFVNAFFL